MTAPTGVNESATDAISGDDASTSPVVLDTHDATVGFKTRTTRSTGRRWRTSAILVGIAMIAGLFAALSGDPSGESSTAEPASADADASAAQDVVPPVVAPAHLGFLAHSDPGGVFDVVALVGVDEGGESGSVVLIPPSTLIEVPSLGQLTVAEVGGLADTPMLESTIENAFGVDVDTVTVLDDAALVAAMAPSSALEVDLHRGVRIDDERGSLAFPAGEQEISAAEGMRLLTADTGEGELDRLVVAQALLDGWFGAIESSDELREQMLGENLALVTVTEPSGAQIRYTVLPVNPLSATVDDELYSLDRTEVRSTMQTAFPDWLLGPPDRLRPRVELLNGTGAIGITRELALVVVPAGGEITLTGNVPGFGVERTQVVYYREEGRADAQGVLEAIGVGSLALADEPLGVIDVTVVVGADLPGAEPPPEAGVPGEPVEENPSPDA